MNDNTLTPTQTRAATEVILAVGNALRTAGSLPSGHLYASVMQWIDLPTYMSIIRIFTRAGLVTEKNHVLTWHEPKEKKA